MVLGPYYHVLSYFGRYKSACVSPQTDHMRWGNFSNLPKILHYLHCQDFRLVNYPILCPRWNYIRSPILLVLSNGSWTLSAVIDLNEIIATSNPVRTRSWNIRGSLGLAGVSKGIQTIPARVGFLPLSRQTSGSGWDRLTLWPRGYHNPFASGRFWFWLRWYDEIYALLILKIHISIWALLSPTGAKHHESHRILFLRPQTQTSIYIPGLPQSAVPNIFNDHTW